MIKRILAILACVSMLLAMCSICFATSGEESFVSALETNITADSLWGAVTPIVGIISFIFIFVFAYRILKKVLKGGSRAKFNM